jgi:exopolysaccharide production protein ExoQ
VLGACAFILTGAILALILDPGDTPSEGNSLFRLIRSISYLSVAAILVPYRREVLFVARRNWLLAALVFLAFVSCLWTETPALVLGRSIALCGTTLLGIALAVLLSVEEQLRFLSWLFRIMTVLSLACVVLLPGYGIYDSAGHEWQGIFGYKNVLGSVMAMSILVEWQLPTDTRVSRILNRLALLLSAMLLFFSSSITPVVALVGAFILLEVHKFATQRQRIPLYATVLAILSMVSSGIVVLRLDSEPIARVLGRSADLTGRTEIWSWVISFIRERPILGYGYSGFWDGTSAASSTVAQTMGTRIMYSHNGYLEMLLTLGVIGFLLTLAFLGTGLKRAYYWSEHGQSRANPWPLAFLFFLMLHNFGECTILIQDLQWSICVAVIASTDPALIAPYSEQDEELLFEPTGEFT